MQIVKEVAEVKEEDPLELMPPLYSVIDTDALEKLFKSTKTGPRNGTVTFEYNGCVVEVSSDGSTEVQVKEATC